MDSKIIVKKVMEIEKRKNEWTRTYWMEKIEEGRKEEFF